MSLGPLMVDVAGTELTVEDIGLLAHPLVGSVILFTRNYRNLQQITALCAAIRAVRTPHLLIAIDHEGGRVQRFREGFTRLPPVRLLGRRFDVDRREGLRAAQFAGWLMAAELRAIGVDFSFAPCVDLDYGISEVIGDRAFHRDPDAVGALAAAYLAGMRDAGMAAVAKHFPGHGAVIADSHVALPVDRRQFVDMEPDLRPYRLLIDNQVAGVMVAHVEYPAIDALPASLSKRCVFADDLSMGGAAVFGTAAERVRLAAQAGCDVLLICNDRPAVLEVLRQVEPDISTPASQARLVRMRGRGEPPRDLETSAQRQEALATMASLSAAPPLVLTEGQL